VPKEVNTDEKTTDKQSVHTEAEQTKPGSKGDGNSGTNAEDSAQTVADAGGGTSSQSPTEVVEQVEEAEKNIESS
jgi:hypothetical protein